MVFSSVIFLFMFLPLTLAIYYLIHPMFRNWVLLISSLVFYFWGEGKYVYVMLFFMVFNFLAGLAIEHTRNISKLRFSVFILVLGITVDLGLLFYFKYFAFLVSNLDRIIELWNLQIVVPDVHLPIGISFFSFQAMSYLIDIYRRDVSAERNIIDFSMYKAFFPQLIAGPIVRYKDISTQIISRKTTIEGFSIGIRRFVIGLAKKVLIANNLGSIADQMFRTPYQDLTSLFVWVGIVAYALQIYFDFSGYSDMAIGLAKMFGFDFLENFNYPYISKTIKEFWRRWHISLSTWFRDYVYISLGGNRKGKYRVWVNLIMVFGLCGLWHGASWTFVVWGLWHGTFLVVERSSLGSIVEKFPSPVGRFYCIFIVLVGWVFFRSDSIHQAYHILKSMVLLGPGGVGQFPILDAAQQCAFLIGIFGCTPLGSQIWKAWKESRFTSLAMVFKFMEVPLFLSLLVVCLSFLANSTYNPFIYFRF